MPSLSPKDRVSLCLFHHPNLPPHPATPSSNASPTPPSALTANPGDHPATIHFENTSPKRKSFISNAYKIKGGGAATPSNM